MWEGLARHAWSDAQLTQLESDLAKLDFLADYQFGLRGERAMQIGLIHYVRGHPGQYLNWFDSLHLSSNQTTIVTPR